MSEHATGTRAAAERGRDWERRRVLKILNDWEYAASISPNGRVTENAIAAIKRRVSEGVER